MKCYISVKSTVEVSIIRGLYFYVTLLRMNKKQIILTLILLAASGYFLYTGFSMLFHT